MLSIWRKTILLFLVLLSTTASAGLTFINATFVEPPAGPGYALWWADAATPVDVTLHQTQRSGITSITLIASAQTSDKFVWSIPSNLTPDTYYFQLYDGVTYARSVEFKISPPKDSTSPTPAPTTSIPSTASQTQLSTALPTGTLPEASSSSYDSTPSPSTLSIGAKTGIAIGAVCGICALSGLLFLIVVKYRAKAETSLENPISEMQDWNGGRTNAVPFVMQERADLCGGMAFANSDGDSEGGKTKWER